MPLVVPSVGRQVAAVPVTPVPHVSVMKSQHSASEQEMVSQAVVGTLVLIVDVPAHV